MSRIICLCGEPIHTGIFPCPDGFRIISDLLLDDIHDELTRAHVEARNDGEFSKRAVGTLSHLNVPGIMQLYECSHCGRLVVFIRANDWIPAFWFQPEKKGFPDQVSSLRQVVEKMQQGEFPVDWQHRLNNDSKS